MKIVVVNYEELCGIIDETTVLKDIILYRCSANDRTRLEWGTEFRMQLEQLEDLGNTVLFADTSSKKKRGMITAFLREQKPDLLVTYNLAGFELCTLTDGLSYNLIDCRQIHFIEDGNYNNEKMLEKEKSINMFFFHK